MRLEAKELNETFNERYTQLIEMEIDTGDSLSVAQSPYTLPLKHYDWVRHEIETL